jgi:transposase
MPKPYSHDFRKKIIDEIQEGNYSKPEIAKRFRISRSFIYNLWSRYETTGSYDAKPMGNTTPPKVDETGSDHIKEWLANAPDLTLNELCDKYHEHFGVIMGKSSMDRALKRMNITYKKKSLRS